LTDQELINQLFSALEERDRIIKTVIPKLEARIKELEAQVAVYQNKKDSSNSHKPPSSDLNAPQRNKSLRKKSNKKPGGQKGHEGNTLMFSDQVDQVIKHTPSECTKCGKDLTLRTESLSEQRQVIDIPVILAQRIEHQCYQKKCSCGHISSGQFPVEVTSPIQYGSRIEALIAYLHGRQFMPYARTKEFFKDVIGLSISSGGINYILRRFSTKALNEYEKIRSAVRQQTMIGTDETGVKVNGEKHWIWTWQNESYTFIAHSNNRGYQSIVDNFPQGFPNSYLGHDRWAAHFQCPSKGHQLCTSHLLRELNFLEDLYQSQWAKKFKIIIQRALEIKQKLTSEDYLKPKIIRTNLVLKINALLHEFIPDREIKTKTLQKKLRKHAISIFLFLFHPDIPPDNNGSERAIRNIKVKQKISGFFKSVQGVKDYVIIRSIIDTTIKAGLPVFAALIKIANLGTE
jgi:transposase